MDTYVYMDDPDAYSMSRYLLSNRPPVTHQPYMFSVCMCRPYARVYREPVLPIVAQCAGGGD